MSAIVRAPRPDRGYEQISHAVLRDARLSYRARGVLCRLLSNADGYQMDAHALAASGKEGRAAILTALQELETAGYLVRRRAQNSAGRWSTTSIIYDAPQPQPPPKAPKSENRTSATEVQKPNAGQPAAGTPNGKRTTSSHTSSSSSSSSHTPPAATADPQPARRRPRGAPAKRCGCPVYTEQDEVDIPEAVRLHGADAVEQQSQQNRAEGYQCDKWGNPYISGVRSRLDARARAARPPVRRAGPGREHPEPRWANDLHYADDQLLLAEGGHTHIDVAAMQRLRAQALAGREAARGMAAGPP